MSGLTATLQELHHGERTLARDLLRAAEYHRAEHAVTHVATDLAHWSQEHTRRLADAAAHYALDLAGPRDRSPSQAAPADDQGAHAADRRTDPALVLLHDLRGLHLCAAGNSVYWDMLGQAAQASKDQRLLGLAADCHPQTLRQMRWALTMIKELSPQALTST